MPCNITRYCTRVIARALGLCGILVTTMCFNYTAKYPQICITECGRQHPVTNPYTLRYRPGKVHVAYRLYIRFCAALIQHKYGTDLLHGSVTDVLSYVLYTDCIYVSVRRCKIQVLYRHFIHICDRFVIISIVYKLYSQVCIE